MAVTPSGKPLPAFSEGTTALEVAKATAQSQQPPASLDPSNVSMDYQAMQHDWDMINDIRAGLAAIRKGGAKYLPKYQDESKEEYERRLASAPWRPEFSDALRGIVSKPFSKDVALQGEPPPQIKDISEDVDGRGNNLTTFARNMFAGGVAMGLHAILVDYPTMAPGLNLAQERASGARPYWVTIPASNIIALYTQKVGGKEIIVHVRLREWAVEKDGYGDKTIERIRVLEPGRWELWEAIAASTGGSTPTGMTKLSEGTLTLKEVPLVLYFTNERINNYQVKPPLIDLANMQIELYQALSRQDEIQTYAGSPMLAAEGMAPPPPTRGEDGMEKPAPRITVGPKTILFSPPGPGGTPTKWTWVQPDAQVITAVAAHVDGIIEDMRYLGMQPMMPRTGDISATADALGAAKAQSAVEAWAVSLKDALEQAFVYTAQWLSLSANVEVSVNTDFMADVLGSSDMGELLKSRMAGEISRETYWDEMLRRGKLGPQFDKEKEQLRLEKDLQTTAGQNDAAKQIEDAVRRAVGNGGAPPPPPPTERPPLNA